MFSVYIGCKKDSPTEETPSNNIVPCPNLPTVTDSDGNVYNTVQIGEQCWMKENLRVGIQINYSQGMTNNNIVEKYCYNDNSANCDIYGGLYEWDEMMQYTSIEGAQGICPEGWHIPTNDEWSLLTVYSGGDDIGGGKMKEKGTSHWNSPNTGATNESGFTAFPGGISGDSTGGFSGVGRFGYWWSSTEKYSSMAWDIDLWAGESGVGHHYNGKDLGFSIRCLKD